MDFLLRSSNCSVGIFEILIQTEDLPFYHLFRPSTAINISFKKFHLLREPRIFLLKRFKLKF